MPANTLRPINVDPLALSDLPFSEFCQKLYAILDELKDQRFQWYDNQRRTQSLWVNGSRYVLATLGTIAVLLTAVGATVRIMNIGSPLDIFAFFGALMLYAIMGAISFWERTTSATRTYFRHLGVVFAVRDLWTKLQFALLKELVAVKAGEATSEAPARERLLMLSEAFCRDLDSLASAELNEWRTEFLASLSELDAVAKKGTADVQKQLQEAAKAYEEAARDAKIAADSASKQAIVNVTITGDFEGQVSLAIDDTEVIRTRLRSFPVDRIRPGYRKVYARATRAGNEVEAFVVHDFKPGLQDLRLSLA
jgi:hypothetical protein